MAVVDAGSGDPVAILSKNRPAFFCIPASRFEALRDLIDDLELAAQIRERADEFSVEVTLAEL
jgi:antitoxin StbD